MIHCPVIVCRAALKLHMIQKFQWHRCFPMRHCWKTRELPHRTFPSCISIMKIATFGVRQKMRSLVSRNFCVRLPVDVCVVDARFLSHFVFCIAANTGGLLGLFMGFSVFSIVEIFYFFTFRPCIHHKKESKKRHQPMKRTAKRYHTNHGRVSKSLLRSRIRFELPENNSVFPYVNWTSNTISPQYYF